MTALARDLCGDLLREHPGRRAREIDLALFCAHQAVDEGLPVWGRLNLVKEAVDRLRVFPLRVDGVIGLGDQPEVVLPQRVKTIVEKVQVDVLSGDSAIQ